MTTPIPPISSVAPIDHPALASPEAGAGTLDEKMAAAFGGFLDRSNQHEDALRLAAASFAGDPSDIQRRLTAHVTELTVVAMTVHKCLAAIDTVVKT